MVLATVLTALILGGPIQPELIERAVSQGDVAALESAREELLAKVEGDREGSDDRVDYTLAYVDWRLAILHPTEGVDKPIKKKNKKIKDRYLKEAEKYLKAAVELDPDDAESHALLGTIHGARISSMWSGMRRGPKADKALKRALELAPDNPRVAFQMGVGAFFKPGMFGGGDDKARAELERALELFDSESDAAPWPNWGHVDAWIWLGQVHFKQKQWEEARAAYEKALEIAPEHVYVRNELMPQLERASESASR